MNNSTSARSRSAILIICLFHYFAQIVCAQLYTGSITGIIKDPSGASIRGAQVELRDIQRGIRSAVMTAEAGQYSFRSVAPGEYALMVRAARFAQGEVLHITVGVNAATSIDVTLHIANRNEVVSVSDARSRSNVENAAIGLTLDRKTIDTLPWPSRTPFDFAFLAPGVSQAPGTSYAQPLGTPGFITNFVSDGSRNAQADVLLDGLSITNSDNNPGVQKALYVPPLEAIEQFVLQQANFSAEFGNSGGTIVNMVTRSGTNRFHGELFEYFRNDKLNANSFFSNASGLNEAHLTRNDFGATLGGPLVRNRTFFFTDLNGIRALTGATSRQAGVPDLAERSGDFGELCARALGTFNSSGICSIAAGQIYDPYSGRPNSQNNAINRSPIPFNNLATYRSSGNVSIPFDLGSLAQRPGNLIDPVGAKLLQVFPLPNLNVGSAVYDPYHNWVARGANTLGQQSFDIKLDQHFSDRDVLSTRFSHFWSNSQNANFFGTVYDANTQGPTRQSAVLASINHKHTFSPSTLLTLSFGYGHNWNPTEGVAASFGGFDGATTLGFPAYINTSGFSTPPTVTLAGPYGCNGSNGCLGGQAFSVLRYGSETAHLLGLVNRVAGKHELKMGAEIRRHRINFMQAGAPNGLFTVNAAGTASGTAGVGGDALATLLIGYVNGSSRYDIPAFTATQSYQTGAFIQDNWRLTDKLTLNLGFRYDAETPRTERYNQMTYFDASATSPIGVVGLSLHGAVQFTGMDGSPRTPFHQYWSEFGPRFGFAYRVSPNTTVRGGYGIYYDPSDVGVSGTSVVGGFLGYSASTPGINNVPDKPWLPLEFLRNPFPFGIQSPTGNTLGKATLLGQSLNGIPIPSLNAAPQEQSWSVDLQHVLAGGINVSVGYVGRKGTHLYAMGYGTQFDALPASTAQAFRANPAYYLQQVANPFQGLITGSADLSGATIPRWKLSVPYPQYSAATGSGVTSSFVPWANSSYNSAQLQVNKGFSNGLQFLFSYVFQKSIDDASIGSSGYSFLTSGTAVAESAARDPNNLRLDRSLSAFSIPQIVQVSFVYQLPFKNQQGGTRGVQLRRLLFGGWQTSGTYRADNGLPVQLLLCSGCSINVPTYGNQYPDLIGQLKVAGTTNLNHYFQNPEVAVRPPAYSDGSAPRVLSNARVPGTNNLNLSLSKEFSVASRESTRLQVRFDAFNAMNSVQFAGPDSRVGNATFGRITTQANQARQVQIALKLRF